jgi:integrase
MEEEQKMFREQTFPIKITEILPTQVVNPPYWQMAISDNTRKAYQSDIRHFRSAGGLLPATIESVLHYLNQQATLVNPRTLKRRLVAIKHWHVYQGFADPSTHPLVKKTLSGIARAHGQPSEKALALSVEQLIALSTRLITEKSLSASRDNALLQIGFFGAFRRSELVAIQWEHVMFVPEGVEILIPRSKTDPEGDGEFCAIPYGQLPLCPVTALRQWQEQSGLIEGFVFRAVRCEKCDPQKSLSPAMVNNIIKRYAIDGQWPNAHRYSGHSLRRGFATAASLRGASLGAIMRQGRWYHAGTVQGYIEAGLRFEANAAAAILEQPSRLPMMSENFNTK